jgi:gamma-glutamylcyclotransferase (GGCT)/AIG2-like uncharacterized protein YtfP
MRQFFLNDIKEWIDFSNREMVDWSEQYFKKLGYPPYPLTIKKEDKVLKQVSDYSSDIFNNNDSLERLNKIRKSWLQYKRRQKEKGKRYIVNVEKDTYRSLKKIQQNQKLSSLGKAVDSLFDGGVFRREIVRLEQSNKVLENRLTKAEKNVRQKVEAEIKQKIELLEEQIRVLNLAIKTLSKTTENNT